MSAPSNAANAHWSASPFPLQSIPDKPEDVPVDFYHSAVVMACIHNLMTRGLNSIYKHAPIVALRGTAKDKSDFITFALAWYGGLHAHHTGEEQWFFPELEHATNNAGLMKANVDQHEVFHKPLDEFNAYFVEVRKKPETLDASRVTELIEAFAIPLLTHLNDEIPTLFELGRRFPDVPIKQIEEAHGKRMAATVSKTLVMPAFFGNADRAFAPTQCVGVFPPMPPIVRFLTKWVFSWRYRGAWRFSAATFDMDLKPNMVLL
ncbi:hypothetical protein BKA62DRAFT_672001 [Auriculariales sp. MPI-PUGE-AT-0066]|nr:hypothetical protein BKA62DRAFT_672001 [Auriculariales sp. MPI-PUGE-AT-0066]